jgi:hypothetical protein
MKPTGRRQVSPDDKLRAIPEGRSRITLRFMVPCAGYSRDGEMQL